MRMWDIVILLRTQFESAFEAAGGRSCLESYAVNTLFRKFRKTVDDLLGEPTFPVWYTDPFRDVFRDYWQSDATPITIVELAKIKPLRDLKLREFTLVPDELKVFVEHCSVCNVRAVKDGCHRLLHMATMGLDASFPVFEASCPGWPGARYDMQRICRCKR